MNDKLLKYVISIILNNNIDQFIIINNELSPFVKTLYKIYEIDITNNYINNLYIQNLYSV